MMRPRPRRRARLVATLPLLLPLAALASPATAGAQACLGAASFRAQPTRLGAFVSSGGGSVAHGGAATVGGDATVIGADLTLGQSVGPFGGLALSLADYDNVNASATTIGGSLGYQIPVGTPTRGRRTSGPQLCPMGAAGFTIGPNFDDDRDEVDTRTLGLSAGLSLGVPLELTPTVQLVPFGGLSLVYGRSTIDVNGNRLRRDTESYGALDLGAGFTFGDRVTVRPAVSVPLGLDDADAGISLLFAFGFGGSR